MSIKPVLRQLLGGTALATLLVVVPNIGNAQSAFYRANVPVEDQSADARTDALPAALAKVLKRLTGSAEPAGAERLQPQLPELMDRYSYTDSGNLRVQFDGAALEKALAKAGINHWPVAERPRMLLWLAVTDDSGGRLLVTADDKSAWVKKVQTSLAAIRQRWALPMILPRSSVLDDVSASDVWGDFRQELRSAAKPYRADVMVLGKLTRKDGQWRADWQIDRGGARSGKDNWRKRAASVPALLEQLARETVSEAIAERENWGISAASKSLSSITVDGLYNHADYAKVDRYLRRLGGVQSLLLEGLRGNQVSWSITASGGAARLRKQIAKGGLLKPAGGTGRLAYRLR